MKPPRHSVYTLWWFVPIILLTPGRNVADCCAASASFCVRVGSNRTAVQCFCAQQTQTNADANRRFRRVFGFVSECAKHYGFWNKVRISLIGLCLLLFWMNECFEHLKWFSTVSVSWVVGRSVVFVFWLSGSYTGAFCFVNFVHNSNCIINLSVICVVFGGWKRKHRHTPSNTTDIHKPDMCACGVYLCAQYHPKTCRCIPAKLVF